MSTPDIVLGGLGGDGPIVTGGLGLTAAPDPNALRATIAASGALQATLTAADDNAALTATLSGSSSLTAALSFAEEVTSGEMTRAPVEVPWMLAAAVDEALMAAAANLGPLMRDAVTGDVSLVLTYDGPVGYDYPAGYDQASMSLGTAKVSPAMTREAEMSGTSASRPGMSAASAPTVAAALSYDGSVSYDFSTAYDAGEYVPAASSMSLA